jgi:single-strand DNA-binding protein
MPDSTVTVVGNLTRDPEIRYTTGGAAKASFGVAVSRRWQNRQSQEWEEQTSFFNVVCWREMAENVSESLGKGSRVVVTGRLEQRSWETENGEKRSVVEIVADEVGPSLRWATAQITRNERRGGGDFGGGGSGGGGGGGTSRPDGGDGGGGGGASRPAAAAAETYDDFGEEPF